MKIQLDTKSKIIKLDEAVNLGELQEMLEKFLPNEQWKEYKLETNTVINNWANPIIIENWRTYPVYPWYNHIYYNGTGGYGSTATPTFTTATDGLYNISTN